MGYKVSPGCDVYGFGILILEMLTGRRLTDAMFTGGLSLHKLVSSAFPGRLGEVLDPICPTSSSLRVTECLCGDIWYTWLKLPSCVPWNRLKIDREWEKFVPEFCLSKRHSLSSAD